MKDLLLLNASELAQYLESLTPEQRKTLFDTYSTGDLAKIFENLDEDIARIYISEFDASKSAEIISKMKFDEAVTLLNEVDDEKREEYLKKGNQDIATTLQTLKREYLNMHPKDVADTLKEMDAEEREEFFHLFTSTELASFFSYLDEEDAATYITALTDQKASDMLTNMDADDAADIINELKEDDKSSYLDLMENDVKTELENLASFDETEAGSIMDTSFICVDGSKDVKDAMKLLIQNAPLVSSISTIFVNLDGKFYGVLDFRKLIVTKSPCLVKDITNTTCKRVSVNEKIEEVLKIVDEYDIYALPVLDNDKIVGIITIDDTLNRLNEEREEDYNQLAGISGVEESSDNFFKVLKNRLPWLILLCILDIFVCLIISSFEDIIKQYTLLILFEPIILGLAGNVGTQSLAVCIRRLSYNELDTGKKKVKHILTELRNSLLIGLLVAVLLFGVTYVYVIIAKGSGSFSPLYMGLVNAISIVTVITVSGLFGCIIPILFDSIHVDPAAASGPFITTINDIVALLIYFGLATIFLIGV